MANFLFDKKDGFDVMAQMRDIASSRSKQAMDEATVQSTVAYRDVLRRAQEADMPGRVAKSRVAAIEAQEYAGSLRTNERRAKTIAETMRAKEYASKEFADARASEARAKKAKSVLEETVATAQVKDPEYIEASVKKLPLEYRASLLDYQTALTDQEHDAMFRDIEALQLADPSKYPSMAMRFMKRYPDLPINLFMDKEADAEVLENLHNFSLGDRKYRQEMNLREITAQGKLKSWQVKYQEFLKMMPDDPERALKLATGQLSQKVDLSTGEVVETDNTTGVSVTRPISRSGMNLLAVYGDEEFKGHKEDKPTPIAGSGVLSSKPGYTLWDHALIGTGISSAARYGVSVVSGSLGLPVADKTIRAKSAFDHFTNETVRALSINPKYPTYEIKRVTQEIGTNPSILNNPDIMRNKLLELHHTIRTRMEEANHTLQLPGLGKDKINQEKSTIIEGRKILSRIGVPRGILAGTYPRDYLNTESDVNMIPEEQMPLLIQTLDREGSWGDIGKEAMKALKKRAGGK